jgi:cephalosporin hydroxylase
MVILDSDHSKRHVLAELQAYSRFVSIGNYLIIEDTNISKIKKEQKKQMKFS